MSSPRPRRRTGVVAAATGLLMAAASVLSAVPAQAANPASPGDFTGYGFDQCEAPSSRAMGRWMQWSPFTAVGIYISGDSRGCRRQANLSASWVATQQRRGWRLLPITLGPQASCHPSFPRYGDDETIDPSPGTYGRYGDARRQGREEAAASVRAAQRLGISAGSTLWYDLEGFDHTRTHCRESALAFLSAWTRKIHRLDYVSGVYSSAGSGIRMLDDARVNRPQAFHLPDRIWIARWDGVPNTSTSYIRSDGWLPGGRMKQYRGGHRETWGGVTINIDSNWLDLGRGSRSLPERHCGGVKMNWKVYRYLKPRTNRTGQVKTLQCMLTEKGFYDYNIHGWYGPRVVRAVQAWREARGMPAAGDFGPVSWQKLHAEGRREVLKTGSYGPVVRRAQRALNSVGAGIRVGGVYDEATRSAVLDYQARAGIRRSGLVNHVTWRALVRQRR